MSSSWHYNFVFPFSLLKFLSTSFFISSFFFPLSFLYLPLSCLFPQLASCPQFGPHFLRAPLPCSRTFCFPASRNRFQNSKFDLFSVHATLKSYVIGQNGKIGKRSIKWAKTCIYVSEKCAEGISVSFLWWLKMWKVGQKSHILMSVILRFVLQKWKQLHFSEVNYLNYIKKAQFCMWQLHFPWNKI